MSSKWEEVLIDSQVPPYIPLVEIQKNRIPYAWDDWNVEAAEEPIDEVLLKRLQRLSQRASGAFAIASAEWIVYRFAHLIDQGEPLQYLETAWAQLIDARYGLEWDPLQAGWVGPVMGPIRQALMWVGDAIEQIDDDLEPEESAATLAKLTNYVLSSHHAYETWCENVLSRLETAFPRDDDDPKGDVVPREAMNPSFGFKLEEIESLVNRFLFSLDRDGNPFLSSPELMLEQGFKGTQKLVQR